MGRPPLHTVFNMINVVFVLSDSSKIESLPHLLNILKSNTPSHSLSLPVNPGLHVQL